jgi:cation:H+ antiporter
VFAEWLGVSELVIGLTVIAAGTSLPELVTSVVAGMRGERDIAVGNIVGSNIFNILAVLGMSAMVAPEGVEVAQAAITFDIPVMIAVALVCLPIFFTGGEISRWEGVLLLAMYATYTTYLILRATEHDALKTFEMVLLWFVIPPVVLMLAGLTLLAWRRRPKV